MNLSKATAVLMLSSLLSSIFPSVVFAAETANPGGGASPAAQGGGDNCGGKTSKFSKDQIQKIAQDVLQDKAECYMKLFVAETSVNAACEQQQVPNPPGIGLCTIEGDPNKRKERGPACAVPNEQLGDDDAGIKNQMLCCKEIMKSAGDQYFQPVKEKKQVEGGQVENCEGGGGGGTKTASN